MGARARGRESFYVEELNCYSANDDVPNPFRKDSIVVEITPRIRKQHAGFAWEKIQVLAKHPRPRVRVSGWLMFDWEHPPEVGHTRGTLWEIQPDGSRKPL
jgi:hypothetical protein